MRPIKFRQYVWKNDSKQEGDMVCWEDLLAEEGETLSCVFSTTFSNASELMQFTGLYDKNGKEIYEGDVAKTYNGHITEVKYGEYRDAEVLGADEDFYIGTGGEERYAIGFYIQIVGTGECLSLDSRTDLWLEVIGNVHENSSLIEVKP